VNCVNDGLGFDTLINIHAAPIVLSINKGSLNNSNNFF